MGKPQLEEGAPSAAALVSEQAYQPEDCEHQYHGRDDDPDRGDTLFFSADPDDSKDDDLSSG